MELKDEKNLLTEHISFYCSKDLKNSIEKVAKKYCDGHISTSVRMLVGYALHEAREQGEDI